MTYSELTVAEANILNNLIAIENNVWSRATWVDQSETPAALEMRKWRAEWNEFVNNVKTTPDIEESIKGMSNHDNSAPAEILKKFCTAVKWRMKADECRSVIE